MFTCVHGGTEAAPTIALIDDLILDHCREIHAELLRRFPARELRIDLSATEKSDLSFLQILHALIRHADAVQTRLLFTGPLPAHLVELAATVGASSLIKEISTRIEETQ